MEDAARAYDTLLADARAQVLRMRLQGVDDKEIFERLLTSLNNGKDLFQQYKGWLEGATDKLTNTVAQMEHHAVVAESGTAFTWELDPTVKEHCPDCLRNSQAEPKSFDAWAELGLPGAGNTVCNGYCHCVLKAAE
jgi:hypothetical protein